MEYKTLVADPPWPIGDRLPWGGAASHYNLMKMPDILEFPLPRMAPDSRLFLWRLASMQQEALDTMKAWGYSLKAEVVWQKTTSKGNRHFGMGNQVRMEHEVCLIGIRGKPERLSASVRSIITAPAMKHSQKPDEFYELVEALSPGPYVELFARRERFNWSCIIS